MNGGWSLKVRISKIIEYLVLFCVIMNATYVVPFFDFRVPEVLYFFARVVPIVTAGYCFLNRRVYQRIRVYVKFINCFVVIWFLFFTIEIAYSLILYDEKITVSRILSNYWCFLYILLVYPIVYLLHLYKDEFLRKISNIVMIDSALRCTASLSESIFGVSISYFLSTKLSAARIGFKRIFSNAFVPMVLDFKISHKIEHRGKKTLPSFSILFLLLFLVFFDQSRSKLVGIVAVIGIWVYAGIDSEENFRGRRKIAYITFVVILIFLFAVFGGIDSLLGNFSVTGSNAASTINRMYSIDYYHSAINDKRVLGMGLLYDDSVYGLGSSSLYSVLRNPNIQLGRAAYFEDFGILGQYFNYGIVGIIVFISFFLRLHRIVRNCKNTSKYYMLLILFVHALLNTIMPISIFTNANMILVPFYLAIFEFYNIDIRNEGVIL